MNLQALAGKDVKDLLTNVGSAGPAAAGGAPAAGGAAAPAEAVAEEKEEGKFFCMVSSNKILMLTSTQRRRSPMTTWDSDFSTKRFNRSEYKVVSLLLFPSPLIPHPPDGSLDDSLLYSILHDPFYEDLDHGAEKKENSKSFKRKRTFKWRLGARSTSASLCDGGGFDRMPLRFRNFCCFQDIRGIEDRRLAHLL